MSTASCVRETWDLTGDDAWKTLAATGRFKLVRDAFGRLRDADGFSHSRSLAYATSLIFVQGLIALVGLAVELGQVGFNRTILSVVAGTAAGPTQMIHMPFVMLEDRQLFEDPHTMSNADNENSVTLVSSGGLADIYRLRAASGIEALITNYGGTVMSLRVPDARGAMGDIVLGYDRPEDYVIASPYFGCLVGRYGNRIAKAKFSLDGTQYTLAANNGENSLHGGVKSFDKVVWAARPVQSDLGPALELRYLSKDGEEGFPGNLAVTARYTLTAERGLRLDFSATTDKKTIVNLTHHSYFNLAGKGDILDHKVFINAKRFTPVDAGLIPTGELRPVAGTPFDFTTPMAIGARIDGDGAHQDEQLRLGGGYDHNWVIDKPLGELGLAARVAEPTTGRTMEVLSTEPGTQLYTGNYLDGTITGKHGWRYTKRSALCFEPQHYPDSPNQPTFPPVVLVPGQTYKTTILYKFSA